MLLAQERSIVLFHLSWSVRQLIKAILNNYSIYELKETGRDPRWPTQKIPQLIIIGMSSVSCRRRETVKYLDQYAVSHEIPVILVVDDDCDHVLFMPLNRGTKIWIYRHHLLYCLPKAVRLFVTPAGA